MSMKKGLINHFALGGFFLQYCVKNGWLTKEGSSRYPQWYLTELGKTELMKFDVDIQKILRERKVKT